MKSINKFFKCLFLLLLLIPTSMQASNEAYENAKDRMYISCMPLSGSSYRFKVLVFSRASYNHWAGTDGKGNHSYICYKDGDKDVKLFEFWGQNYEGVNVGNVREASVKPVKGQGAFSVNEVLLKNDSENKCKTLPASIIEGDQESLFLQIDWTPDYETFKGIKSFSFFYHVYDECKGTDYWRDNALGKFSYNNTLQQPRLIQPYIDLDASKDEQGRMVLTWTTMKECDSITYNLDGDTVKKSANLANSGTFYLPQTNSVRTLSIDAKLFQDEERKVPVVLTSNSVEVPPYHAMSSFSVTELGGTKENNYVNRGFNKLEWAIDYPSSTDYIPGDQFVLKRGYRPDLSDAETIGVFPVFSPTGWETEIREGKKEGDSNGKPVTVQDTIITKAIFTHIDSTVGAYRNVDAEDKTTVFTFKDEPDVVYENGVYLFKVKNGEGGFIDFNDKEKNALDNFFQHFVTCERKVYYSVERATASSFFSVLSNKYFRKDSVKKSKQLPLVTRVSVVKLNDWERNHKTKITVTLDNYRLYDLLEPLLDANLWNYRYNYLTTTAKLERLAKKYLTDDRMYDWDKSARILMWRHARELKDSILIEVPSDSVRLSKDGTRFEVTVSDAQPDAFLHYYYTAYVDASQSYLPIAESLNKPVRHDGEDLYYEGAAHIKSFEASMDQTDGIRLTWSRYDGSFSSYQLQKREEGSDVFETIDVEPKELEKGFYLDTKAQRGKTYEYRLVLLFNHYGMTFRDDRVVVGKREPYAIVKGRVKTSNGVGVAGIKMAVISSSKNTCGAEVMKDTVRTEADGSYSARVVACEDEVTIKVAPVDGNLTFSSATSGSVPPVELTSTLENSDYNGVDFILEGGSQFVGRVLYKNSTIPVSDATFKVNGMDLYNAAGKLVKTDAYGNFSFMVPPHPVSVRVVKEGHQFDNDGYIHEKNKSAKDTVFTPDGDYVGLELVDNTRIRMIGKIAGGATQGGKPVGFGNLSGSENVLGDSITLVLQLEGDNTAQFVFLKATPDITTIDTTYQHYADTVGKTVVGETKVSYQKKRIVVVADNKTGEFALDLFPARYKIIQMYANGYATLFAPNEGAQVLDLTDPSLLKSKTDTLKVEKKTYYTRYNAMYKRIYHCPATLTYKQNVFGLDKPYLGDEQLASVGLMNDLHLITAVKVDPKTKEVSYLFKHPVFNQDVNYTLKVSAREDYYYNNEKKDSLLKDSVPVSYGTLNVNNGLTKNGKTISLQMDSLGRASFSFKADNPTFTLLGEDALRTVDFSVEVADYYYDAKPLKAYVLGTRKKGSDGVVYTSENADMKVLDVLRDPPGSKSYSFIGKGAKYTFSRSMEFDLKLGVNLSFSYGSNYTAVTGISAGAGPFTGTVTEGTTDWAFDLPIPIYNYNTDRKATYEYVVNEAIKTSGAEGETGSMYDVYIGTGVNVRVERVDAFSTIDYEQYKVSKPAIESGAIKVVAASTDSVDGHPSAYIVINELLDYQEEYPTYFAYTQRYILGTLLPKLILDRNALLKDTTKAVLEEIYNKTKKVQYRSLVPRGSANFGMEGGYERIGGSSNTEDKVANINHQIRFWINMIYLNDSIKVKTIQQDGVKNNYSISSGTDVTYKENSSLFDSDDFITSTLPFWNNHALGHWEDANNADFVDAGIGAAGEYLQSKFEKALNYKGKAEEADIKGILDQFKRTFSLENDENGFVEESNDSKRTQNTVKEQATALNLPGASFKFKWKPTVDFSYSDDKDWKSYTNLERGFYLGTTADSYMDIQVFPITAVRYEPQKKKDSIYVARLDSTQESYNESVNWTAPWAEEGANENALYVHDFVFSVKGGATRPYEHPDSTLFYKTGTPLGHPTMKIDNPKIQVLNPIRSNVPSDERVFFDLVLTNESEVQSGLNMKQGSFTLKVDDRSNPKGLKVYIDGVPLSTEYTIKLRQGETIRKTIEVVRGTASDYENVALMFRTGTYPATLTDMGYFSVHYVPTSTPLTITSPVDKWVLNTLQPKDNDSTGYYLSVDVEGFDLDTLHYPNFDHIEIQYKETNKGEDAWVNLCSFYKDSILYEQASGVKERISGNNAIKGFKFYGGKDPIEMKYDIRAVSFSRLGTSFVTRSSNVVSGIKDTRCPRVFGNPEPTNGVLMYGDVIRLPFTEPIAYNYLDKTANFSLLGYINNQDVFTGTSLKFDGNTSQSARSSVVRNLVDRSFTVDMMVRTDKDSPMTLFSHGDQEEGMSFGIEGKKLVATINGVRFSSSEIDKLMDGTLNRVGMMYNNRTHKVTFFKGNERYPDSLSELTEPYRGNGVISLGTDINNSESSLFSGSMKDVRLWNDTLSFDELTAYKGVMLKGYEHQLIAHYPLTETQGDVAKDVASGADLTLSGTTWDIKMGHSLRINKKAVTADPEYFRQNALSSYTLMFWFKTDDKPADADTIAIFSAGRENLSEEGKNKLAIRYEGKNLVVRSKGVSHSLGYDYADAEWHNVTLAVNRTHNAVTVYVDGRLATQCEASEFEGISSDYVALGSSKFKGNIDDLSLWKVVLPAHYIETHYNAILKGDEQDLVVYLPFCRNADSDQGLAEEPFSPYNEVKAYEENVSLYDSRSLVLTNAVDSINDDQKRFAPLRNRMELQKLDFDWSSNGTDLMINILTDKKKYNHQNLYLTVRNVEDLNGNTMRNAEMWSVYTDLNQLSWLESRVDNFMNYGELDPSNRTFSATIFNYSGTTRNYVIQNNESWLTPMKTRGECAPEAMTHIEFEVSDNLNAGEYVDYVTLLDENGLFETLEVHVKVVVDEPSWNVEKANNTMNYIGIVKVKTASGAEVIDNNPNDIISAFVGSKCVGKAKPSINRQTGESYLYMTIYGDSSMIMKKSPITFKIWNSSTGEIMDMKSDTIVEFIPNFIVGCPPSAPDTLHLAKSSSQQLKLNKGWNWISMNVTPSNILNNLFAETSLFSNNDEIKRDQYSLFDKSRQMWRGSLKSNISRENVYQIYVANPGTYNIVGTEIPDSLRKVSIKGGGTWNDLPYPMTVTLPLINALADFPIGSKAQIGDVIKTLDQFAVAKGQNEWIGTLDAMRPGYGYYLYHQGDNCEIRFADATARTKSARLMADDESTDHRYASNMPVMAVFDLDVDAQEDDKLVAYVGDEKVGEADRFDVDGSSIYFLSVQAADGDVVTFAQQRGSEILAQTKTGILYDGSAVLGTLTEPYVISFAKEFVTATPRLFDETVEFVVACEVGTNVSISVHSVDGKTVWNQSVETNGAETRFTMNGATLPAGVYMATVVVGEKEQTIKLIRK